MNHEDILALQLPSSLHPARSIIYHPCPRCNTEFCPSPSLLHLRSWHPDVQVKNIGVMFNSFMPSTPCQQVIVSVTPKDVPYLYFLLHLHQHWSKPFSSFTWTVCLISLPHYCPYRSSLPAPTKVSFKNRNHSILLPCSKPFICPHCTQNKIQTVVMTLERV